MPSPVSTAAATLQRTTRDLTMVATVSMIGAAAVGYVAAVNPSANGSAFLPCPFHRLTGLWCPGCGLTRGTHQLLTGHPMGALGYNIFTPLVLVLVAWGWLAWAAPAIAGRAVVREPVEVVPRWLWYSLAAVAVAYGIARNLPVAWLRPLAP
jgi:hypothetical protein